MNIGIDITALGVSASGGIGTSLHAILEEFAADGAGHDFTLYGTRRPLVPFTDTVFDPGWPVRLGSGPWARSNIAWLRRRASSMLAADAIDVFWGARQVVPADPGRCATVVTIHDLWDRRHPDQLPMVNRLLNRWVIDSSAREADVITPISFATAAEIEAIHGVAGERVAVVQLGVDGSTYAPATPRAIAAAKTRAGIDGPYLLAMDAHNPRKNAERVIEAFAALPPALIDTHQLVLLGAPRRTARPVDIHGAIERAGIGRRVVLPGDAPFGDLPALYSGAAAFAFPSVYEGFGMPVLEAMSCGCPVVTSTTSSLPEVAGEAGLLVDPSDVRALSVAFERVLTDATVADRMRADGLARAATFTWRRTAQGMLDAFERAARLHAKGGRR